MEINKKLSIVIPTYNRADFLDYSLEVHIPMLKEYGIEIAIFDNASTDNTQEIVSKWMKEYDYLTYHKNETNIGPDANFEKALKYPDSDYVWLLGDTYKIQKNTVKYILDLTGNNEFDHILVNVGNELQDIKTQIYQDQNKLLYDLFWLMTCLSVHIYKSSLIKGANFSRYHNSNFIQTGIIFEYINNKDFKIYWNKEYSVERILSVNGLSKDLWIKDYFKIWVNNRINLIMSLPPSYLMDIKLKTIRYDNADRKELRLNSFAYLRIIGVLNLKSVVKYKDLLLLTTSRFNYFVALIFSMCPQSLLVFTRKIVKFLKSINKE